MMIDTRFAPTTAGMDSKNENFTAKLRSKPRSIPALIVVIFVLGYAPKVAIWLGLA